MAGGGWWLAGWLSQMWITPQPFPRHRSNARARVGARVRELMRWQPAASDAKRQGIACFFFRHPPPVIRFFLASGRWFFFLLFTQKVVNSFTCVIECVRGSRRHPRTHSEIQLQLQLQLQLQSQPRQSHSHSPPLPHYRVSRLLLSGLARCHGCQCYGCCNQRCTFVLELELELESR